MTAGRELRTLKGSPIRRWRPGGVGKEMRHKVWVHRDYAHVLPQQPDLARAARRLPRGFRYNVVKFDPDAGFTFFDSPDFDEADEPTAGDYVSVGFDGSVRHGRSDAIWHHKWMWVDDDYAGFDVDASFGRSRRWLALPGVDFSRIGNRDFWEEHVVPRIPRSNPVTSPGFQLSLDLGRSAERPRRNPSSAGNGVLSGPSEGESGEPVTDGVAHFSGPAGDRFVLYRSGKPVAGLVVRDGRTGRVVTAPEARSQSYESLLLAKARMVLGDGSP